MTLDPAIEKADRETILKVQNELLKEQLDHVKDNSPFYRQKWEEKGVDVDEIESVADLWKLPTTTKDDLQRFNDSFICVPRKDIVEYVTTSGTLGDPVTFVLTDNDLDRLAYNEALSFECAGCGAEDTFQLMTTLDRRFVAGLAYFLGVRKLGGGVVRVGSGIPQFQWDTIQRMEPNVLITVPSFLLKLLDHANDHGIDPASSSVEKAVCIGEPIRDSSHELNNLGKRIKDRWDIQLFSTYASTEMATAFTECENGTGGHHHPELIIVEYLDEEGEPVPPDQPGEVTVTPLGVEGMPLVRYRTGDICYREESPCDCGRTTHRIGPVIGRRKQMIKYKGTTLYPPALYDILNDIQGVEAYIVEVFTNDLGTDEIKVRIGTQLQGEDLEKSVKDHFRARLRVSPTVEVDSVERIQEEQFQGGMKRKPVKFIDKRDHSYEPE